MVRVADVRDTNRAAMAPCVQTGHLYGAQAVAPWDRRDSHDSIRAFTHHGGVAHPHSWRYGTLGRRTNDDRHPDRRQHGHDLSGNRLHGWRIDLAVGDAAGWNGHAARRH